LENLNSSYINYQNPKLKTTILIISHDDSNDINNNDNNSNKLKVDINISSDISICFKIENLTHNMSNVSNIIFNQIKNSPRTLKNSTINTSPIFKQINL